MRSFRDPIHGFIHADRLETALIDSRPMQRLRFVRQLGLTYLVYPGAEHSRFSHALGTMELAGRVYDVLAARSEGLLEAHPRAPDRRTVRAAALLHDIGHAPFSHSAEDLFADGIDHEEMSRRLLATAEIAAIFDAHGEGLAPETVTRLLARAVEPREGLLAKIVSGELDADKMDYLLRDSLFCGVRYGSYDLERLLDTIQPIRDPQTGEWGIGVDEGGVHALEALVMARYYMFTQVYFNPVGKALELHFNEWLRSAGVRWPTEPEAFLRHDDVWVTAAMRQAESAHARALVERVHYPLAYETREHLDEAEASGFFELADELRLSYGRDRVLLSHAAKEPHRLRQKRVLVRSYDGTLEPMDRASHFIGHLARINRIRVYTAPDLVQEVAARIRARWPREIGAAEQGEAPN